MSGYWSLIHFGTYQPMIPSLPAEPKSSATFWSVMYVLARSSWPQFSRMTSVWPEAKPCQDTCSVMFDPLTVQPSLFSSTYFTTA